MKHIADRIRAVRGQMTQGDFALKLGINPNTLRNYENKRALPNHEVLETVCTLFSINPEWLLLGVGSMPRDPSRAESPPDPPPIDKEAFVDIVEALEEVLEEEKATLAPKEKAELLYALYLLASEKNASAGRPIRMFKLIKAALDAIARRPTAHHKKT